MEGVLIKDYLELGQMAGIRLDSTAGCSNSSVGVLTVGLQHVLAQPQNWCIQATALLMRSRWEKGSARRLQRSLAQLEVMTASCIITLGESICIPTPRI